MIGEGGISILLLPMLATSNGRFVFIRLLNLIAIIKHRSKYHARAIGSGQLFGYRIL